MEIKYREEQYVIVYLLIAQVSARIYNNCILKRVSILKIQV